MENSNSIAAASPVKALARSGKMLYLAILLTVSFVWTIIETVISIINMIKAPIYSSSDYIITNSGNYMLNLLVMPMVVLLAVGAWLMYSRATAFRMTRVIMVIKRILVLILMILIAIAMTVLVIAMIVNELNVIEILLVVALGVVAICLSMIYYAFYLSCGRVLADAATSVHSGAPSVSCKAARGLALTLGILVTFWFCFQLIFYIFGTSIELFDAVLDYFNIRMYETSFFINRTSMFEALLKALIFFAVVPLAGGYNRIYGENADNKTVWTAE